MGLDFEKPELGKPGWGQKVDANFEKVKNYAVGVDNTLLEITKNLKYKANYNYIINGDFSIWQRGISFKNLAGNEKYTADRWKYNGYSGKSDIELISTGIKVKALQTIAGTNNGDIHQPLELSLAKEFLGKTLTFSAKVKGRGAIVVCFDSIELGKKVFETSSFETVSVTFKFPDTLPTWRLLCLFDLNYLETNAELFISNAKLEISDCLTPFMTRLPGEELALCQRYYQTNIGNQSWGERWIQENISTGRTEPIKLNPIMRVSPTITFPDGGFTEWGRTPFATSAWPVLNGAFYINRDDGNPFEQGHMYLGAWAADAEIY